MPWHDLAEIKAWETLNGPVGGWREDLRMSILAAVIHSPNSKKALSAMDFMPYVEKRKQSSAEMMSVLEHAARAG